MSNTNKVFTDIWFVGDSYIHWAEQRALQRGISRILGVRGVNQNIVWSGHRGMRWDELNRDIQFLAMHNPVPRILIIHLGSNDLGDVRCSVMRRSLRSDILALHDMFPHTRICVSAMLPRIIWSRSPIPVAKIERKRRLLNRFLRRLVTFIGGRYVAHEDITSDTPGLYFRDGVHLSDVGSDLFLLSFKTLLEELLGA